MTLLDHAVLPDTGLDVGDCTGDRPAMFAAVPAVPAVPGASSATAVVPTGSPIRESHTGFAFEGDDPLGQARAARDRHEAGMPPLSSYADFDAYWRVIAAIGLTSETSVYLREHLRLFLEPMGRPTRAEVVGVVPMPRAVATECVRLMRIEGGYARRVASRALFDEGAFGRAALRAALPAAMRDLPETWLCREHGDDFDAVPGGIVLRLTMIRSPRLRAAAILEVLLLAAEGSRAGLDVPTAAFERWDDAFDEAGLSPDRGDHWLEVAGRYCITRELQATHPNGPRISAYERWGAAGGRRAQYVRDHDGLARGLRAARLPALPAGREAKRFVRAFRKERERYGLACTDHRAVDADQLKDNFADRLAAAQLRARQGVRLWREAEAGAAALRASPGLNRQAFTWTEEVLSPMGRRRRRMQTVRMEAVYRDVVEAELLKGGEQHRLRFVEDETGGPDGHGVAGDVTATGPDGSSAVGDAPGADGASPGSSGPSPSPRTIVFRLIGVVADDGAAVVAPWWVDLFGSGVLLGACRLTIGLREARRAAMVRLRVPAGHRGPSGLVGPDGPADSRLYQRALNAGVVLVAAEPFGHGMAIGAVAMRTLAVTFARVGELLQMVRRTGEDAWRHVDVEGRGRRPGWMALAKGARTRTCFVIYDERTMPLITTLTRMRLMRERSREVGVVPPWRALARKVGPDRYVFAFRGRMLDPDDLNYIYQVLMAGIQRVRNHDLRHGAANRSSREPGVTEADVAFRLGHAGAAAALPTRGSGRFAHAATYARDTARQRDDDGRAYCDARLAFERLLGVPLSGGLL